MTALAPEITPRFGPGKPLLLALLAFAAICFLLAEAFGAEARVTVRTPAGEATARLSAEPYGFAHAALEVDGKVYAIARLWDHDGWSEVAVSNGSIEDAPGTWQGDYSVECDGVAVERHGAQFFDGTGYLETFGTPRWSLGAGSAEVLDGFGAGDWKPLAVAAQAGKVSPTPPSAWPIPDAEWSALDGTVAKYDSTPNRHQTGSAEGSGDLPTYVARRWALHRAGLDDDPAARLLEQRIYAFIVQQARRPSTYLHRDTGQPFRAAEWPKLTITEFGLDKSTWGSTVDWGRWAWKGTPAAAKGYWSGFEPEHLTRDNEAAAVAFLGGGQGGFALEQLRLLAEATLSQRFVRAPYDPGSTRSWGWCLKGLAWSAALDPDEQRAADARGGIAVLAEAAASRLRYSPIAYWREDYADGRHVFPTWDELAGWTEWRGLDWPAVLAFPAVVTADAALEQAQLDLAAAATPKTKQQAAYALEQAGKARVKAGLAALDAQQYGESTAVLLQWSYQASWQVAIAGKAALFAWRQTAPGAVRKQLRSIAEHAFWCCMTHARNYEPGGTFRQDWATRIHGRYGPADDDGLAKTGVVMWTAGFVAQCVQDLSLPAWYSARAREAALSCYASNKYVGPEGDFSPEWALSASTGWMGWKP